MKKLLVIVGPTGVGKSALGLKLAKKYDGEIVSADSRQIYKGMDIGTGKESQVKDQIIKKGNAKWEIDGIPIHLYDLIDPDRTFSVAEFQQRAYRVIDEIHSKGKLPILVGGTGLYIQAVVEGMKIPKAVPDINIRKHLETQLLGTLVSELAKVDPQSYESIDKQNRRRVERALEVYYQTGEKFSSMKAKFQPQYKSLIIGLTAERGILYERSDRQVEKWFSEGFIDEVKGLLEFGYKENLTSMSSIGYRQVASLLKKIISIEEAKSKIKWDLHGYIRRQLTWFRKMSKVNWFDINDQNFGKDIEKIIKSWLAV